jgi:poly-gamma-glutamate capsule biosynthesis protein CapA/YwtB (metallophosphatase superfamily)
VISPSPPPVHFRRRFKERAERRRETALVHFDRSARMKRFLLGTVLIALSAPAAAQQITLIAGGDVNWSRTIKPADAFFDRDSVRQGEWPRVPFVNTPESVDYLRSLGVPVDTARRRDRDNIEFQLGFASDEEEQRHPLQKVAPLLQAADIAFVNLENPLSADARFSGSFRASPGGADALRWAGIDVVSVANNHAFDAGEQGLFDTMHHLWRAGVGHVGGGRDLEDARRPFIIERNGIRVAFLGYTQFVNGGSNSFALPNRSGVAVLDPRIVKEDIRRVRDQVDFVAVSFHWGTENRQETEPEHRKFAHDIIDAGADIILGHHPHVPRGIEAYNGKVIVYSFGNLIFGHSHPYWMNNYLARFTLDRKKGITQVEVIPVAGKATNLAQPFALTGAEARELLEDVQKRSAELDTRLELKGDVGTIRPSSARITTDGSRTRTSFASAMKSAVDGD